MIFQKTSDLNTSSYHQSLSLMSSARCSLWKLFVRMCVPVGNGGGKANVNEWNCVDVNVNPLNAELNPTCYLLALLGAYHFLHVSRIRVKSLTLRLLMSYIYIYTHTHTHTYMEHLFLLFLDHTQRRSTVGRTPLDE